MIDTGGLISVTRMRESALEVMCHGESVLRYQWSVVSLTLPVFVSSPVTLSSSDSGGVDSGSSGDLKGFGHEDLWWLKPPHLAQIAVEGSSMEVEQHC